MLGATAGEASGTANAIDSRPFERMVGGRIPSWLKSPAEGITADKNGVSFKGGNYLRTKDGNFLSDDFTIDVTLTLDERKQQIAFIGLGEAANNHRGEPQSSVFLRFHSPA